MVERFIPVPAADNAAGGLYFAAPKERGFINSGCQLLDLVLGGGWAEGRVANIIGDKCISGHAVVSVQRGTKPRKMTLADLFARVKGDHHNKNDDLATYLLADVGGHVGMVEMLDVRMTGVKSVYEIKDDQDHAVRASEDHRFLTDDGWSTLASGLTTGNGVRTWRETRGALFPNRNRRPRHYTYSIPYHPFGQKNMVGGRDYKRLPTCRLVLDAAMNGLSLQELIYVLRKEPERAATLDYTAPELEVHHRNGDTTDDSLKNLRLVTPEEHWAIHASEMPENVKATQFTRVVAIDKVGEEETYDVSMAGPHNFVADGFVVHNSTGKTLLCIEAAANFVRKYKKLGRIYYREVEAAFDVDYAKALGMPVDRVDFSHDNKNPIDTVEDLFEDMEAVLVKAEDAKTSYPLLYIVDSLDALSDRGELKRDMDKGSYGTDKSKLMSQLFRRLVRRFEVTNMTVIIVSQVRSKIGVTFGERTTRSGGRALDFYGSQFIKLAHLGVLYQTRQAQRRAIGVQIKAKSTKNKIGLPFRECEFDLLFGYGIDDLDAGLRWLDETKGLAVLDYNIVKPKKGEKTTKGAYTSLGDVIDDIWTWPEDEYQKELARVRDAVEQRWWDIEKSHLPTRRKY